MYRELTVSRQNYKQTDRQTDRVYCRGASLLKMYMCLELYLFQESDNEMIISDVHTGEFIAKKIIYD